MLKSDRGNLRTAHMVVRWIMFVLVFIFQLAPAVVQANPTGGDVVAGQANISNSGNTTTIHQASQTAVINWQDFSIAGGEVTKFVQPNQNSAVLNKVIGNNVSQIYGTLQSNGQVFLVNQSGVFVGAGGVINTAGFVASTLDLDTDTFMKGGDMKFAGNSQASIVNMGKISGTDGVFLISQKIENNGNISASKGEAGLAAGSEVLLKQAGDERTSVLVGSSASGTGISNKGEIAAAVATMKATGSMYSVAVNNEGIVRAQGVNMSGGKVRLTGLGGTVVNSGTLSAKTSNEKGGTVIVEGKNVGLITSSVIDVSGKKGGGTALVGGGFQGKNSGVINAEKTYVSSDSVIKADSVKSGNGGTVVVWSDDATQFFGSVSAKGGSQSGNGGFAEISGKGYLNFQGQADVSALKGQGGTILFDPLNIAITNTADTNTGGFTPPGDISELFADDAGLNSNFDATAVTGSFAGITAGSTIILQATNDINVMVAFDLATATGSANNSLVLQAGNDINIGANLSATGTGTLTLSADDNGSNGVGTIILGAGVTISTANQAVNLSAANLLFAPTGTINAGTGTVTLTATNNRTIGFNTGADLIISSTTLQNTTAGTLIVNSTATAGAAITVLGISAANSNNVGTVVLNASGAGGDIVFSSLASTFNALTAVANDQIDVNVALSTDTGALNLTGQGATAAVDIGGVLSSTGAVTLTGNNINITSAINAAGQVVSLNQFTAGSSIQVGTGATDAAGQLGISDAEGDLVTADTLRIGTTAAGALTVVGAMNPAAATNLNLISGGNIAINGVTTVTGDLRLQSNGATITQGSQILASGLSVQGSAVTTLTNANNDVDTFAANVTTAGSNIQFTDIDGFSVDTVGAIIGATTNGANLTLLATNGSITQGVGAVINTGAGNLTAQTAAAGGVITFGQTNLVGGNVSLLANQGGVTFTNNSNYNIVNITTGTGNFNITLTTGAAVTSVGQTGAIATQGNLVITADAGAPTDFLFNFAGNTIGNNAADTVTITATNAGSDVTLFNNSTTGTTLATSSVGGALTINNTDTVSATSSIRQVAASNISVGGQATFITQSTLIGDVNVDNNVATVLGSGITTVAGDYTLNSTSGAAITQTGAVRVRGTFTTTGPGSVSTVLDNQDNIFANPVVLDDGSIFIRQVGDINLAAIGTAANLTVIALQQGSNWSSAEINGTAINLTTAGTNSFGGGLVVQTGGAANTFTAPGAAVSNNITQTDAISVGGTATFRAPGGTFDVQGGNILLNNAAALLLTGPIRLEGKTAIVINDTATNLAASTINGTTGTTLSVTSVGNITNSGVITTAAGGQANFATTGGATTINLNQNNVFAGAVGLNQSGTGNVALNNTNAAGTILADVNTAGGDVAVTSSGAITQSVGTSIVMTGAASDLNLSTTAGNITLNNATNSIVALGIVSSAGNFSFDEANGYNLTGNISSVGFSSLGIETGNIAQTAGSISSAGLLISQNGVAGVSTVTLDTAANNVGTLAASDVGTLNLRYVSSTGFSIDTVNAVNGINALNGNVRLETTGAANINLAQGIAAVGNIVINTAGAGAITRSGAAARISTDAGNIYLRSGTLGTALNPLLVSSLTAGSTVKLSARSLTAGTFLTNDLQGNLSITTFDPSSAFDTVPSDPPAVAGVVSATDIQLRNTGINGGISVDTATSSQITASGGIIIQNSGALTQTADAVVAATGTNIEFQGGGSIGTVATEFLTSTPIVILNKTGGNAIIDNATAVQLQGTTGGSLTFETLAGNLTINASNLVASTPASTFELIGAVQIVNGGGFIDMNNGSLSLTAGQVGAAVDLEVRDVTTLAGVASAGAFNVNSAYNPLTTGNVLTLGSVTGLSGTVNGINAVGAITVDQAASNSIVVANTAAANDIQAGSNISLVVAASPSGPDQLIVQTGAAITSGAGNAGAITIRGGVNNQGALTAGAGTTILLDGGRPDLILGGSQTYNGSVTFQANDDLIVTGSINQIAGGAVMNFLADFDNNGTGGFILTDDVLPAAGIFNLVGGAGSQINIEGSNLITNTFGPGTYGGSVGNGVVIDKLAASGNAIQLNNSGLISLTSKDVPNAATNDIIIDGTIVGNGATSQINLISDAAIAMSQNVTSGGVINVTNSDLFSRTAAGATLNAGTTINFAGIGNLGTLGTRLLTNAALLNFDSAGNTKAASSAFIQETNSLAIEGSLNLMDIISGGSIDDTANKLIVNTARLTASTGSITLDTGHAIQVFDGVSALGGSFTYIGDGDTNLTLSNTVQANAGSGIITINLADPAGAIDRSLTQNAGAIIAGNRVVINTGTASLNAFIRRSIAASTQNVATTITTEGDAAVTVTTSGTTSLISTDLLTVNGVGSVGTSLVNGLHTDADALVFNKSTGNLYVFEDNNVAGNVVSSIAVSGSIGTTTAGTLNVSASGTTQTANINLGTINADNGSNIHLIGTSNSASAQIQRSSGAINMTGGELLLQGRQGVGQKAAPIVTNGSYELAGGNNGTAGGFYIRNDGTGDIIVSDIAAFTPASLGVAQTFNGVLQASTGNTNAVDGDRNIRIVNNDGSIRVGDRIQTTLNNQQVLLIANNPGGQILQEDAQGVINMVNTVGTVGGASQLYLLADSGIGAVDNALRTNGTFTIAANSSNNAGNNVGGIYITNVGTATQANAVSTGGTVTIGSVVEAGGSSFITLNGLTTNSPAADADIRLRNNGASGSNIVLDNLVQASVGFGANTVGLIASNGAIVQGTSGGGLTGRIVSEGDGIAPGEVMLIANQGIGTLASALRVNGNYNLAVANSNSTDATTEGFLDLANVLGTGAATGNINILNSASGPLTGLGNVTITDVADSFTAGGTGINTYAGILSGGLNTADTAASGAIRITNTNTGVDNGDIIAVETIVQTTGTTFGTAFINLVASDDVLIGSTVQTSTTVLNTLNGAITLTAANGNDVVNDGDAADGVVIVGDVNNATLVQSFGTAGVITLSGITDAHADVTIHSALVQANGTIAGNAVIINANDDILLGDGNQETLSLIQTINGGISLTATNASTIASGTDAVDGILVQASNNALNGAFDDVYVNAQGANGAMTITATANNGVLTVNGGADNNGQARLRSDTSMAVDVDLARLNGGTGNAGIAQLVAGTTQTVFVRNTGNDAVALDINGGSGNNAQAGLYAGGAQTVRAFRGDITLDAGNGNNSRAEIETTVGNQIVSIGFDNTGTAIVGATGDLLLNGGIGAGTNSRAFISMLDGTASQTIRVVDNITLLGGVSNNNDAIIRSSNTQSVTGGNALTTNNITLTGGTGTNAQARIDADNTQTVTAILGNLILTGGDGNGSNAAIRLSDGKNGTQGIFVQNGDLILLGNQAGSDSDATIEMNDVASSQTIRVGINSVGTTTGDGVLVGVAGTGANSSAGITSAGTQNVQVIARAFDPATEFNPAFTDDVVLGALGTIYDFTGNLGIGLRGGGGLNSRAGLSAANQQDVTVTAGDIQILGGSGDTALAGIQVTGIGNQTVTVQTSGNVFINGGSGPNASAGIYNFGADADSQTVSVQNGTLTALGGSGNDAVANIVHFGDLLQSVLTSGTIRLIGGSADNTTAGISAEGISSQTVTVSGPGDIIVQGGTGNAADAFINANGFGNSTMTQAVTVTNGNLLITGGTDATNAGDAFVQADSTASTQNINVGVTLANSGRIVITGGTGVNGDAFIDGFGQQNVNVRGATQTTDTLVVLGGTGNGSEAFISKQGDATDTQSIHVILGNFTITGGAGLTDGTSEADAYVRSNSTVTTAGTEAQRIVVDNGNLILTASLVNSSGSASLESTGALGAQFVNVGLGGSGYGLVRGGGTDTFALVSSEGTQQIEIKGVSNAVAVAAGLYNTGVDARAFSNTTAAFGFGISGGANGTSTGGGTATVSAVGNQTITVRNGDMQILGGFDLGADALVSSTGLFQTITLLSGTEATVGNGLGNLILAGTTNALSTDGSTSGITLINGLGTQAITVGQDAAHAGAIGLFGGQGQGADVQIFTSGILQNIHSQGLTNAQAVTAGVYANGFQNSGAGFGLGLQGGLNETDGATALIGMGNAAGRQEITIAEGDMQVIGGVGLNATANVESFGVNGVGFSNATGAQAAQLIVISNGNLIVDATNTDATPSDGSSATIMATNTGAATQFIDVDGATSGRIIIQGGNGQNDDALIQSSGMEAALVPGVLSQNINSLNGITITGGSGGATGPGTNSTAGIAASGDFGQQLITVQNNNLSVLGGVGQDADAFITADGINNGALLAQTIIVSNGNLLVDAGNGTAGDATAFIEATNTGVTTQFVDVEGTISVLGGDGGNEEAFIRSAGFNTANGQAQNINSLNAMLIQSGNLGGGNAFIESTGAFGRQLVTVQTGNLSILAGTGGGNQTYIRGAGDNAGVGQEAQRVIVSAGNLIIDANSGTGGNAAFIDLTNTTTATQVVDVEGTISVLGGDGGGEQAFIRSAGFNTVNGLAQDINSLNAMLIQSGNSGGGNAFIESTGAFGRQLVTVQTGNLSILAGTGGGNQTFIRSAGTNTAVGQEAQRVIVSAGNLIIDANSGTGGNSAFIDLTNATTATQVVDVEGTISVLGGDGGGEQAFIRSAGFNASLGLAQNINALSGMLIEGGNASGGGNAFIDATGLQGHQLVVVQNNNLQLLGGSGAGNNVRISSAGLNGGAANEEAQRILVQNGNLILNAGDATAGGTTVAITQTNAGTATQFIDVNGTLTVQAGAGTGENATINADGFNATAGLAQSIDILSGATLTGGGDGSNARILGTGANGTQTILVQTNNLSLLGGIGNSATALIDHAGLAQNLTVSNGALLVRGDQTAAGTGGAFARIRNTNTTGVQTINVTNGGITVTGGVGGSDFAEIVTTGTGSTQDINTLTAGSITVNGGSGNGAYGAISAGGTQDINSVTSINVNGGTAAGAYGAIEKANAGTQDLTAATTINLNDGTGALARISHTGGGAQTIRSTGTTNLTGDSGFESLIESTGTTDLINAGGTWTGVANVTATTSVTIENTGAIVINETPGTGMVTAPTLIFVNGNALVGTTGAAGSASTRLNTDVDSIFFNAVGTKTVNISETNGDVALRGTVGTVNLINVDSTDGSDITDGTTALNAVNATFQTANGDIDFDGQTNGIQNFRGVVANDSDANGTGGNFTYLGGQDVTVLARAASSEIPAGQDIFASNTIVMDVGGNTIRLAGGSKVQGTAPGAGDGTIASGGDQTYQSNISLVTDYLITSNGLGFAGTDVITFNGEINGLGGLGIGSSPVFNNNIGTTLPIAYLFLNSPVTSTFNNPGGNTAVINGSFVNQGGGDVIVNGAWTIFVDNGVVGPGPGIFSGGNVVVNGSLAIFAPTPGSVTGTGFDTTETFIAWNGGVNGQPVQFITGSSGIFYKAPPPTDDVKDKKNRRKDVEADYTVSYDEGVNAGSMVVVSGVPLAETGGDKTKIGGLLTTSYGVNSASNINSFYFGREVQAPIQLETDKLVNGTPNTIGDGDGVIISPNRN